MSLYLKSMKSLTTKNSPQISKRKITVPNERNFRKLMKNKKLNYSAENIHINDKDTLASSYQTSANFFFGYDYDPKKTSTLRKYYRSGSTSAFIPNATSKRINDYYESKVDNKESDINKSCYRKIIDISKEDYANYLNKQIEEKKRKKEEQRLQEIKDFQNIIKHSHEKYKEENKEKYDYFMSLKANFINSNNKLQVERRAKREKEKKRELQEEQLLELRYQDRERKCEAELRYEQFRKKEYLKEAIINQIKQNERINKKVYYK